uniref:Acyl-CoA thioesterase 2 n=1 Tax=Ascaris suum TaxID=6253 RepID=F1KX25_ASCSU
MRITPPILLRLVDDRYITIGSAVLFGRFSLNFHKLKESISLFSGRRRAFSMTDQSISKITIDAEKFFEMEKINENIYRSTYLRPGSPRFPVVYGGLLFAQSLAAAEETVPAQMRVHAMHSMFILAASIKQPIDYVVRTLRDGRSFCSRTVDAIQNGATVFTCQISFHLPEEAAIEHQIKMPSVVGPEECPELFDGIRRILNDADEGRYVIDSYRRERLRDRLIEREKVEEPLFEMRPTNLEEFLAIKPSTEKLFVWVRSSQKLSDNPRIHRMMAVYNTDSTLAGVALKAHQSQGFIPSQVLSLDHCMWLHRNDFRADEWMLYENSTAIAASGRAFTEGHLWARDGRLICSTAQECLIRSKISKSNL